jgi:hypothetical protein
MYKNIEGAESILPMEAQKISLVTSPPTAMPSIKDGDKGSISTMYNGMNEVERHGL